jgi:hypothetical protein
MEAPVCNTLVNVEMFLERFLIFNREKLCYDNGKSVPNAFYDEEAFQI